MLDTLLTAMGAGSFGSIIGVGGAFFNKWMEAKNARRAAEHEINMRRVDLAELKLEQAHQLAVVDKNIDLAEAEGQVKVDLEEAVAFTASQRDGGGGMDVAKSLMRPLITLFALALTTYVFVVINARIGGLDALPVERLVEIYGYIINQIIFLTVLSVSWWFAARPSPQQKGRHLK